MAEQQFAIVFRGALVDGADAAQVRANFARLFNIDAARVEQMFGGQPVIIKKGLDLLGADKYKAALEKAGAVVEMVDLDALEATKSAPAVAKPAAATAPTPALAATSSATAGASATAPGLDPMAARNAPPAALRGTPQALASSMAEPGVMLVEPVRVAPAAIATEHLSMADAGTRLIDYAAPPEPRYDLSGLTLDPPGVVLVEPRKTPPPQFDLSALSLDDAAR